MNDLSTYREEITGTSNLATALAKAQGAMSNAKLNKINPHFKSKYADLASVRDASISALSANGLSIIQFTKWTGEGAFLLVTRLMHESGEYVESEYPLPNATDKPQVMGSAFTYARRYSWAALIGISAEDDDDAEAASVEIQKTKRAAPAHNADAAWKELAEAIKRDIDAFAPAGIAAYMVGRKADLETIRGHSDTAYQFLLDRAEKKTMPTIEDVPASVERPLSSPNAEKWAKYRMDVLDKLDKCQDGAAVVALLEGEQKRFAACAKEDPPLRQWLGEQFAEKLASFE